MRSANNLIQSPLEEERARQHTTQHSGKTSAAKLAVTLGARLGHTTTLTRLSQRSRSQHARALKHRTAPHTHYTFAQAHQHNHNSRFAHTTHSHSHTTSSSVAIANRKHIPIPMHTVVHARLALNNYVHTCSQLDVCCRVCACSHYNTHTERAYFSPLRHTRELRLVFERTVCCVLYFFFSSATFYTQREYLARGYVCMCAYSSIFARSVRVAQVCIVCRRYGERLLDVYCVLYIGRGMRICVECCVYFICHFMNSLCTTEIWFGLPRVAHATMTKTRKKNA